MGSVTIGRPLEFRFCKKMTKLCRQCLFSFGIHLPRKERILTYSTIYSTRMDNCARSYNIVYVKTQHKPRLKFTWSASVEKYLDILSTRHGKLTTKLLDPECLTSTELAKFTKDHQELSVIMKAYDKVLVCKKDLLELAALAIEESGDLKEMAEDEAREYKARMADAQQELLQLLIPVDKDDDSEAILEVRAGTGGKEAALFTGDIFSMYQRFAAYKGWRFDTISLGIGDNGGIKDASAFVSGPNVFRYLKYEIGVHRVQRIPVTESQGRIHTSTMTVAVLPQPKEIDSRINPKDIKIDTFRASGAGGQHVNTTDSAVRLTHLPTGIVVAVQEERSQLKNRTKAMKYLEAKLYDMERCKIDKERRETRRVQIGTGDRSERIRTYNFLQDRVTDHRVGISLYGVKELLEGTEVLDTLIKDLRTSDQILSLGKITDMPRVS